MGNPMIRWFMAAGAPSAVNDWRARLTDAMSSQTRVVQDRSAAKALTFSGVTHCPPTSLPAMAEAGTGVHMVTRWDDATGHVHWKAIHDGVVTDLQVPDGGEYSALLSIGPRAYNLSDAHTRASMGPGALRGLIGIGARLSPLGSRPVSLLLDPTDGPARPGNGVADRWWDADLRWDGDAIALTDVALGHRLRDTCNPVLDSDVGGWAGWAWDALTAWATTNDIGAGELGRAVLCAAQGRARFAVPMDDIGRLDALRVQASQLISAARGLAPLALTSSDLTTALCGTFTTARV